MENLNQGIVLVCDTQGKVLECLEDNLGISEHFPPGEMFLSSFKPDSFNKALNFIINLKNSKSTFNWVIDFSLAGENISLQFGGGYFNNNLLILASEEAGFAEKRFNEISGTKSGDDETTTPAVKESTFELDTDEKGRSFLDELNRLNNEIVNYQNEISTKNMELEKLDEIKNQFLGMAAHDLRNPLGNIKFYSEFLLDEKDGFTDEQVEYIESINSLSQFMIGLVNDLLDITNIESGNLNLEMRNVNLNQVIEKNIKFVHLLAEKKNIDIVFTPGDDPIQIALDQRKINQVLTNLFTNAIKYSFQDKKIFVGTSKNDSDAVITIKDEGQGIPAEELPNLFQPFHKTSVQSTDGEKSTGLGLVIVRKIIEAHNGRIWVDSKQGEGSTFTFSLPTVN